jgi:predicted ATP-grasp superfamily ATP-dependent carboligase
MAIDYPVSTSEPGQFVDWILEFVRANQVDLVIPVTDWTLGPLSAERERFAGLCRIAMPSYSAVEFASDKFRTIELSQQIGIAVPKTCLIGSSGDLIKENDCGFPVVVKDRFSVRWIEQKAVFGSVAYAYSREEAQKKVSDRLQNAGDVLVQEFVSGQGIGVSCFVAGGRLHLPFQWLRVREVDPRGSASSARKSIPLDDALISQSQQLITRMGFEGIAMLEYKRTPDGRLVLMEINGRPWGSIGLPVACGIDYPRYLIDWCLEGKLPPEKIAYRENVLCRRAVSELTHLSNIRRGRPKNWPGEYPNFWRTLLRMAIPWHPGMCYDDVWISDLRPGIAGLRNWFQGRAKGSS